MKKTQNEKYYCGGRKTPFNTLEEAKAYAELVWQRRGIIIAVEKGKRA